MSSARFTRTMQEFKQSPEASAPAPTMPYHDILPSAPSSAREISERRDRLARPDNPEGNGIQGMVPEAGSIAQTPTRSVAAISEPTVDIRAQQIATVAVLRELGASDAEIRAVAEQMKTLPMTKLLDIGLWKKQLERIRKFRRGTIT